MTNQNDAPLIKSIAILGGTGKEGSALAQRWALKGYKVIIGSRDADRAQMAADEINTALEGDYITGKGNADAASEAEIVVLSVPYSAHAKTLESVKDVLSGKILVDITAPTPYKADAVLIPEGLSAAQEAQNLLGSDVYVVSAFQNVGHNKLKNPNTYVDCDVLVTGDDADAKMEVMQLVEAAGMRGVDAGPLANAIGAEALTAILIYINKTYKAKGAGIRITGIE